MPWLSFNFQGIIKIHTLSKERACYFKLLSITQNSFWPRRVLTESSLQTLVCCAYCIHWEFRKSICHRFWNNSFYIWLYIWHARTGRNILLESSNQVESPCQGFLGMSHEIQVVKLGCELSWTVYTQATKYFSKENTVWAQVCQNILHLRLCFPIIILICARCICSYFCLYPFLHPCWYFVFIVAIHTCYDCVVFKWWSWRSPSSLWPLNSLYPADRTAAAGKWRPKMKLKTLEGSFVFIHCDSHLQTSSCLNDMNG